MGVTNFIASAYDAIVDKQRRRAPKSRTRHEDRQLTARDREKLTATARDVQRNFTIAKWAIGKHLDFVSSFSFQAKTGNPALDAEIERLIKRWQDRNQCDVARRHPLRRLIRLAEARMTVDGDVAFLKVAGQRGGKHRGRLQAIEGDRIAVPGDTPKGFDPEQFRNGIQVTEAGETKSYCICNRDQRDRLTFGRVVPARNVFFHANWDRFDQTRGISPIASALNPLQDIYEGFDNAFAKLKVSQMFGLVTYQSDGEGYGDTSDEDLTTATDDSVDFGRGPFQLDLEPDEKAEFLESRTPSTETVEFLKLMVHVVLRSLDIPYSFFDESFTNFYGSRGGLIQYLKSCKFKILNLQDLLNEITRWRLGLFVADGELVIPAGMDFNDLAFEWVPDGVPWWDPAKEIKGHTMAIAAGLSDFQRVCHESGTDFFDNIDRIAEQQAYAKSKGVALTLAGVTGAAVGDSEPEDEPAERNRVEIPDDQEETDGDE